VLCIILSVCMCYFVFLCIVVYHCHRVHTHLQLIIVIIIIQSPLQLFRDDSTNVSLRFLLESFHEVFAFIFPSSRLSLAGCLKRFFHASLARVCFESQWILSRSFIESRHALFILKRLRDLANSVSNMASVRV
jgi:hypothetical protein